MTVYKFRMVAHNKVGQSPASEPSPKACRTNTDVPYKNPERVVARWDDSNNLVISWKPMPPSEHNGHGFGYNVMWRGDFPGPSWSGRVVMDWTQDRIIASGVYKGKPYRVRVEAHNLRGKARVAVRDVVIGRGGKGQLTKPRASDIVEMAFLVLAVVPEVINAMCDFAVAMKWRSRDDNHTPILFYSSQYTTNHNPDLWDYFATNIPASDNEFRLSLKPLTVYKFRVTAHKVGQSPVSEPSPITCKTNTDVPYKNPERVAARWDDADNLVISWKPMPPSEHNGRR
ncbi:hypothetical protein HPB49_017197 [Dermacentor silvarum]|uniref:Uncharacterized protein n=1 Tax=Dermacentor silvarum TaxID=543639 RepID=A0ACB8DQD9_DERSI|nr:hypothetical protein HPB49_017197 [Dermacentor silvarum]